MLIQGIFFMTEQASTNEGFLLLAPHPARPLPSGDDGAWVAHQEADIQVADINPQLQRGRW